MAIKIPQKDTAANQRRRQTEIANRRGRYQFERPRFPAAAKIAKLPSEEAFDGRYMGSVHARYLQLFANATETMLRQVLDPFDNLQDFEDLYPQLPRPSAVKTWREDHTFAEQRLAGPNPMVLKRVTARAALPADSRVTDADVVSALGPGKTLDGIIGEGRLYLCDHGALTNVSWGPGPSGFRMLPAPFALFYWRTLTGVRERGELVPVAIQIARGAGNARVFTPTDPANDWLVAKAAFQVADGNHHEMATHLGRTHLILEAAPIAVERNLSANHPLSVLLRPHLKFLLAINEDARTQLIGEGGRIYRLLAGTLDGSLGIADEAVRSFRFADHALPRVEVRSRGLDDATALPHYPYRDDGWLVFDAIERFVKTYVELYYTGDADVVGDTELRGLVDELTSPLAGGWQKLNADGSNTIATRAALVSLVAGIIWTSGPQHAAVNYPQWDYIGAPANMPLALYAYPPGPGAHVAPHELLRFFPPGGLAAEQIQVMYFLGTYRYDQLGHYPAGTFPDPRALPAVAAFQAELSRVEAEIRSRNQRRRIAYTPLLPSLVPNSTSV